MPSTLPDPLAGAVVRTDTVVESLTEHVGTIDESPRGTRTCIEKITEKDGSTTACNEIALSDAHYCGPHFVTRYHRIPNDKQRFREQLLLAAKTELLRISPGATRTLEELVNNDRVPANVRLKAATEILDRVGIRGGVELEVTTEVNLSPSDDIRRRLETMAEAMLASHNGSPPTTDTDTDTVQGTVVDQDPDQLELELLATNNAVHEKSA